METKQEINIEKKEEQQDLELCSCGDDSCDVEEPAQLRQRVTAQTIFRLLRTNQRFNYLVISFVLAMTGLILNWFIEPDWIEIVWITSSIIGLIVPVKLAIKSLKKYTLTINTLLVVATVSALILQLYEEAVILVIIFSIGEILEGVLVNLMRRNLDNLKSLIPSTAVIIRDDGSYEAVSSDEIQKGDRLLVRSGDIVPVDSTLEEDYVEIQKAHLTGESEIIVQEAGDKLYAGSIVVSGSAPIIADVDVNESKVNFIVKSVEDALGRKSSAEKFSDKFGKYYTPSVFVVALFIAIFMPLIDPSQDWLMRALVILVVSCACGLAVSVPVTMVSAVTSAAREGILIRGGAAVERIAGVNTIIFDKTGTLTYGSPIVKDITFFEDNRDELLPVLHTMAQRSNHPISRSMIRYLENYDLPNNIGLLDFREEAGIGLSAMVDEDTIQVIRDKESEYTEYVIDKYGANTSYSVVKRNTNIIGLVIFEDKIRDSAIRTISQLKNMGKKLVLISGDKSSVVKHVASELGIDEYYAEVLPEGKVDLLNTLSSNNTVAMIGDGINDAPALAHADVSFAMGHSGVEVASDIADVVLVDDDLSVVPRTIRHATRAFRLAKINTVLALLTVFALLTLAFTGILDLVSGIIANEFTAVLIIANGLRMLKIKK